MARIQARIRTIKPEVGAGGLGGGGCRALVGCRTGWHRTSSGRIFRRCRQLFNAIAARSTDAPKRSSWYRIRVTRSARSAALR